MTFAVNTLAPPTGLLPASVELCDWAAQQIVLRHAKDAPDLTRVLIFVPEHALIPLLRRRLRHHLGGTLLGPNLTTLRDWAAARGDCEAPLSPLQARIQLAEALAQFPHLFPGQDALTLAAELQALLDQLTRHAPELSRDPKRFLAAIEQAYGATLKPLTEEAAMVDLLWRGYLEQTGARNPALVQAQALRTALGRIAPEESVYVIGHDHATPAEVEALRYLLQRGACGWFQNSALCQMLGLDTTPLQAPGAREQALDELWHAEVPAKPADSLFSGLSAQPCTGPEHEARVAELAIRRWLLEGKRDIAVISNDRRFARRLRALLDRAHIPLNDAAGWALSTSRAAASLTHWLDALEQDFYYQPLLDLLKSSFYSDDASLPAVHALEALTHQGKTAHGLKELLALTEHGRHCAKVLGNAARRWPAQGAKLPAPDWSTALIDSLRALPLWSGWQTDTAGRALIEWLEALALALRGSTLMLDAAQFRRLLDSVLESASFTPDAARGPVRLLTLEQASLLRCEALLLSGAAAGKFPGTAGSPAFFNQGVRAELGLPHWAEQSALAFERFRRLLLAAPEVLITYAPEDETQDAQACPWIDYLQAYGLPKDPALAALAGRAEVEVAAPAPARSPRPGANAAIPKDLLPTALSATAHQTLIDCPYQFFVRYALRLKEIQTPDALYNRGDYGMQAHTILQAFYHAQPGLPAPFPSAVTEENRDDAARRLQQIAQAVFQQDLNARVMAGAWLAEFEAAIPQLLDQMVARQPEWPEVLAENQLSLRLPSGLELYGRIDRLERNPQGDYSVVDYKTGTPPKLATVLSGEAVQAVHYALLSERSIRTEYWPLSDDPDDTPVVVEGEDLQTLRGHVQTRLEDVMQSLAAGTAAPANGNAQTCNRCPAHGICRLGSWSPA